MKYYGLDIGTSRLRLLNIRGQMILDEANCLIRKDDKHLAWGEGVKELVRRQPEANNKIIYPMVGSRLNNYEAAKEIFSALARRVHTTWLKRPNLIASISAGSSTVETQALRQALSDAGWGSIILVPRSVLGLLGSQVPLNSTRTSGLIEIGAGSSEVCLICYGNIVTLNWTSSTSGERLVQSIKNWLQKNYKIKATDQAVEALLSTTDALSVNPRRHHQLGKGDDKIIIKSEDLAPLIHDALRPLVKLLQKELSTLPIQSLTDIMQSGLILSGGVANLRYLNKYLSRQINVVINMSPHLLDCTLLGIKFVQKNVVDYQNSLLIRSVREF